MKRAKTYEFATVICVCGEQVGRVPASPQTRHCPKCKLELYFTNTPTGPVPWVRFPDSRKRQPGQRRPRLIAAVEVQS